MAAGSFAERPATLRLLGIFAVGFMVLALLATYAIYNDAFSRRLPVTVKAKQAGLDLMTGADVKVRGVFVGEVTKVYAEGTDAVIELQIDRSRAGQIPSDVQAVILPTTLFGPKFVDLQPTGSTSTEPLQANQVIQTAKLPIEVENVLNDLYPILTTLKPAQLSTVINAVASALDGRGEKFGQAIETLSTYLEKFAPLSETFVSDIKKLGDVASVYADVMPELGSTIADLTVTDQTIIAKRAQLSALYTNVSAFALSTDELLRTSGDDYIAFAQTAVPTLQTLAAYAPTLKCVVEGTADLIPKLVDPNVGAFRGNQAHVSLQFAPRQPTPYTLAERPRLPSIGSPNNPTCAGLPTNNFNGTNIAPGAPDSVLRTFGMNPNHRKTADQALPLPANQAADTAARNLGSVGSEQDRAVIDGIVGGATGKPVDRASGLAALTVGSALRGAEVSFF